MKVSTPGNDAEGENKAQDSVPESYTRTEILDQDHPQTVFCVIVGGDYGYKSISQFIGS